MTQPAEPVWKEDMNGNPSVRRFLVTTFVKPTVWTHEEIRYVVWGYEKTPTTHRDHWHGYMEFSRPHRMTAVKKWFADKTMSFRLINSRDHARAYCMATADSNHPKKGKTISYVEYGSWTQGQGERFDIQNIVTDMKTGTTLTEIMLEKPQVYCQYRNGMKDIAAQITKEKTKEFRKVRVVLLTGPTGCGKTREAMARAQYRIQGTQLAWWQDYDGEEVICIDEYSNDVKITELLNLLDGYQLRLNVKGSHTYANWHTVYITTNLRKHEIHSEAKPAHRDALFRRITDIKDFWPSEFCDDVICDEVVQGNVNDLDLYFVTNDISTGSMEAALGEAASLRKGNDSLVMGPALSEAAPLRERRNNVG